MSSESAAAAASVVQPPVPKPRVARPLTSPPHQQSSSADSTEEARAQSGLKGPEHSRTPSPVPKPTPPTTAPGEPTDDAAEEGPVEDESSLPYEEVVLRHKSDRHQNTAATNSNDEDERYVEYDDEQDEGDYENIDAHLNEDAQRQVRRSDYLNWVFVESDDDDGSGSPLTGRAPPSIKLHKHPALKKSQSSHDVESSPSLQDALALKKQFEQHLQNLKSSKEGVRPKNRAPPPPPGSSKQRGGDRSPKANRNSSGAQGSSSQNNSDLRAGHKRSQSDARVIDYSERERDGERKQGQVQGEAASGRGAPGLTSGGGGGVALRGQQQAQRSPHSHAKNPRNKPPDPPLQLQRKHSPREAISSNNQSPSNSRNSNGGGGGLPPPPSYAPPPAPAVTSSSSSSSSGRPSGGGGEGATGRTPPTFSGSSSHYQQPQSRRPNPPRTSGAAGGQRGQSAAVGGAAAGAGGQDKGSGSSSGVGGGGGGGKDKERTRVYAGSNIRHPPPPPTSAATSSNSAATASASGTSSSSSAVEDGRARGGGGRREELQVYDRSPKLQHRGRQGAEKVYELLSKAKASRQDRDRERERESRGGQSPGSIERQTSTPGGGEGAAVYAKPKRHAPPPPGSGGGTKKVGGASAEIEISEGPPDYTAVMGGRDSNQAPPPKPVRQRRTQSSSDLTQPGPESGGMPEMAQSSAEERSETEVSEGGVLTNMDVFTIDLRRDGDQGLGLMIVSGKARNSNGDVAEGVFVQKVLPGSLAERDGRIQAGDMLVRVANQDMVGGALEKATELLQQMQESIRLRIGRPDASSSVVVVQDGEEQPIYETLERISPTERDLMMKLEKSQMRVAELEEERKRAERELKAQKEKARRDEQALRQQLRELQEMLDSKKAEHDSNVQDLTQTLATVTIEKTKVEKALEERKNEVETLRQQLSDVTKDKASVDEILKEANHKLQETEDELGQIKHEKSTLWTELVSGRERISDLEEKLKAAETNNATLLETIREQAEEICSLKAELGRPCEIPRQPPPLPVKPSEEPPQQLPIPPVDNKSSVGDDDAFEEGEPSPVAPCPYISFVPLQDDPRARHKRTKDKDGEDGRSKKSASSEPPKKAAESSSGDKGLPTKEKGSTPEPLDTTSATAESGEAKKLSEEKEATKDGGGGEGEQATVAEQGDQEHGHRDSSEEPVAPLPDFDVVKPLQKLDSRAALHKSQVGGQIKRKKPSRDHLRQMGSSSNLLDAIPDELLEVKESSPSPSPSSTKPEEVEREPASQEKEKEKEKEREEGAEQTPSKKPLLPPSEQSPSPAAAPAHPPKPKPRAAPRRKPQEHPTSPNSDASKPLHPQAAPRQKSEGRELSPPPEKSGKEGVNVEEHGGDHVSTEEPHSGVTASPKIHRKEPMMPSPVLPPKAAAHSPKHSPSHRKEGGSHDGEDHTPKPLPRGHGKAATKDEDPSANDPKIAELMKKDPSELTVKEKALLAQKAVGALGHDKTKLPPPVPRKPKPGHGGEGDVPPINSEHDRGRSHSIDEKEEGHGGGHPSPMHSRRKLPPGAVNIMAGLPLPSAERGRSLTVSTTEPGARERNSLGRNASLQDYAEDKENGVRSSSQEALDQTDHGSPTKPLPKTPPKRPPVPMQKKSSNERPANVDGADSESDASPALGRKMDGGADDGEDESHDQSHDTGGGEGGDKMDLNTVLSWSPEVVGQWLNSVGLGQYKEVFVGVQGYMLFDYDGHRLKGLGMSSHDDRNLFKKEVKNLKPYADKHKKILEKQRKEEKKNAKKKKK